MGYDTKANATSAYQTCSGAAPAPRQATRFESLNNHIGDEVNSAQSIVRRLSDLIIKADGSLPPAPEAADAPRASSLFAIAGDGVLDISAAHRRAFELIEILETLI